MTHLNPPCIGRTYKITLLFNPKMTLKPNSLPKQETWKFIIQTLIAILTAIGTTLGVTSCMM